MYYVQIRRGGFPNPSPWGEKDNPFHTLEAAKDHVKGCAEMADKINCCIDYLITDGFGNIVAQG